jgi:hypothetical protein
VQSADFCEVGGHYLLLRLLVNAHTPTIFISYLTNKLRCCLYNFPVGKLWITSLSMVLTFNF